MIRMGDVWDRATEFVSDTLSTILPIAVLAIFLPYSIAASIAPVAQASIPAGLAIAIVRIVLLAIGLWGYLAIVALGAAEEPVRRAALRIANARIVLAIGISLILFAGTLALTLPLSIGLGLSGVEMRGTASTVELSPTAAGVITVYMLALLPLVLFLQARLLLITPVIAEERRGIGTLRRSFVLTRGLTWKLIGVSILYSFVFGVSYLAAKSAFGTILQLIVGGDGVISVATVMTSVLVGVVMTIFVVLAAAFTAKLYVAARAAHAAIAPRA